MLDITSVDYLVFTISSYTIEPPVVTANKFCMGVISVARGGENPVPFHPPFIVGEHFLQAYYVCLLFFDIFKNFAFGVVVVFFVSVEQSDIVA